MPDESQRDTMNAAIRAHRARRNVPRSIAPEPLQDAQRPPEPERPRRRSLLERLRSK
jgi:hypothetical protein